jgi:hypothetical protein
MWFFTSLYLLCFLKYIKKYICPPPTPPYVRYKKIKLFIQLSGMSARAPEFGLVFFICLEHFNVNHAFAISPID